MTEIVIDPEVPDTARRELEHAPLGNLVGFCDSAPVALRDDDEDDKAALGVRLVATGSAFTGGALGIAALYNGGQFAGDLGFAAVLLLLLGSVLGCLYWRKTESTGNVADGQRHATASYHRRYVVPRLDLRGDELARWRRASAAARSIRAAEVVRLGLIDTVPVAAVLPYHLWEVAERLALLSEPERRQAEILEGLDPGDPDLQVVLGPQRRVRDIAVADIERRIGRLEEFAALASRADATRKRQRAIEELAKLNPGYEELLLRLDGPDGTLAITGQVATELHALIVAADDAVREANEAGRTLALPEG